MVQKNIRIGIVAAEASGDQLASHLMGALNKIDPSIIFEGIGGDKMKQQGLDSWYPMEKLSVMGLVEVLKHLPELLRIRKVLFTRWKQSPPDVFVGVDAPDFNLGLETKLKAINIPTVHYVCPSIWAWRQGRVKTLKKGVDLILSIFPFEVPLLAKHDLKSLYAGHPLAQTIDQLPNQLACRDKYNIAAEQTVLGLLPGSRMSEVTQLTDDFLEAALLLSKKVDNLVILAPMATQKIKDYFLESVSRFNNLNIKILDGESAEVMAASDIMLTASGTASLEIMLHKKPMVVAYKVHWLTHFILFKLGLVSTKHIAMPNILANERIVPELFQEQCTPELLANNLQLLLDDKENNQQLHLKFEQLIAELVDGSIDQAAEAVLGLVKI